MGVADRMMVSPFFTCTWGCSRAAIRERANDEVDVQFIGEAWAAHAGFDPRARCRPLRIGCSVGTRSSKATGTLACFVAPQDGGPIALLSNNHVLADEGRAAAGAATLQPGWDDSGRERSDTVARLDTVIGLSSAAVNEFDCATAILAEGVEADRASIEGVGTLSGVTDPEGDAEVAKVGRTSALTHGRIAAVEVGPVPFQYGTGLFAFDDLVEIHGAGTQRFAQGGDSGSLVVERDSCHAVGMVMGITTRGGGNGAGITYANDLPRTLEKLRMRVVL